MYSNLQVFTTIDLNRNYLAYNSSSDSFQKIGWFQRLIRFVKNIFYTITFSHSNAFSDLKLLHVAMHIKSYLAAHHKTLTAEQFF